ncbi:hypothetical protein SLS59_007964 [Nothophoma quercina]|uniref:F-box domain-containing protein n=1 Tax=Nothophoma quercina TaxID=749835 RepID=A0ABR3QVS8_9PLEO
MVSDTVDLSIQEVIMDIARDEERKVPTNAVTEDQDSTHLADDDDLPILRPLQKSAFLALPGEIMNCIYSFAKEEDKAKFAIKQDPNGTKPAWQFLALAQVCRGIRSEYLPLYRASLNLQVQPRYVYSCLDTFFVPSSVKHEGVVGRLEVAPPCGLGNTGRTQEIDLKRLIMLSSVAQDFHVRFSRVIREEIYEDEGDEIRDLTLSELMKDMVGMKDWLIFSQYVQVKDIETWSRESGMVPDPECTPGDEAIYVSFTTASLQ